MLFPQTRQTHSMRTRDGVRLDADVYYPTAGPADAESFPVLLMRQPYGRAIASTVVYAHPRWYAAQGYIVVIQDVRGRGTSEGTFHLFAHEVEDGEDTVEWAAQLPGSDGQVGMYGFSYQGMTQLQAAQAQPKPLKTIAPAMTGYYLYEDWAYENGALCLQIGLTWALQLAAETARLETATATHQKLVAAAHHLPLFDPVPARPNILADIDSFFHDWVAHPHRDSYWQKLTPQLDPVDLPMLHIGGWFDPYLRGDLRLYQEMSARSSHPHPLWIGPWGHIPWGRKVGAVDFGPAAISPIDSLQIRWFDRVLKGKDWQVEDLIGGESGADLPVCLFEMGRNQWRQLADWPEPLMKTYFLQSDGLANIREDRGVLVETANMLSALNQDVIVHDPWNPAPALGGHSAIPAGVFERTAVDSRGDVLTYTTAPLTAELRVAGVVEVDCAIAASTPSYDLCAVLSRVRDGKVYNLTQGYQRADRIDQREFAETTEQPTFSLKLHPTCFSLEPGEALRLSLSAACFPAYPVNPGTGAQPGATRLIDAQVITLSITTGGANGSRLRLPVMNASRIAQR